MTGVRRGGLAAAVVLVLGAALVTALLAGSEKRPVDVRLVSPKPPAAVTVTASATTTVAAVGVPTPVPLVPETLPAVPVVTTTQPTVPTPVTTTTRPHQGLLCEDVERCLPWVLDPEDACKWLRDHGLTEIEVRGRHGIDVDRIICGD